MESKGGEERGGEGRGGEGSQGRWKTRDVHRSIAGGGSDISKSRTVSV